MAQRQDVPSPDLSLPRVAGLVVVDKPLGWTSHDVVSRMRRLAGTRKVGHAGTLDPAASGVLVIGVEKATKLLTYVTGTDKTYRASIRLGAATVTDDAEGEVTRTASPERLAGITDQQVMTAVGELTGEIQQVPSAVSAIKVDGKRSYARVRSGEDVQLAARPVTVSAFDVHEIRRVCGEPAFVDVEAIVTCSSGTYVRALARDLGAALGVGGHLTALRRTRVGSFTLEHAHTLDELAEQVASGGTVETLEIARAARLLFPVRELGAEEATDLSHGRRISASPEAAPTGGRAEAGDGPVVACFAPDGTLVALAQERGAPARRYATSVLGITVGTRFTPGPGETPGAGASDGAGAADGPDVASGDDAHGSPQRQDDNDIDTGTDA
ncbi:tRNA pseudouridine(55) synthase TruB [Kocuria tytonicola]|uniref:tRNA pseudouridine synthase B n=1 Tax=Kocuria tytonicola TaxID=2055946 RepID=A0A3L9L0B3_9MICC|nr:tRNA pseudouridine(55) synthase TruB [Kocuria tytonicola]RLY92373.1 tRNA pseudouridine(55) synthase TruB [Kocuria tytonicola]